MMKFSLMLLAFLVPSGFAAELLPMGKAACVLTAYYDMDNNATNSVSCDGTTSQLGKRKAEGNLSFWMGQVVTANYQIKNVIRIEATNNFEKFTYQIFYTK